MSNSAEHREQVLSAALEELKEQMVEVMQGVASTLYTDYLPHVETDTESNIGHRVTGVVKNLIRGNFKRIGESQVEVSDDYGCNHYIPLASYSQLVKPLCDAMGEEIKGERIKQLEHEVRHLRDTLSRSSY